LIVFATNTVVEVLTVVVKVLDASVASVAMMALIVDLRIALSAEH